MLEKLKFKKLQRKQSSQGSELDEPAPLKSKDEDQIDLPARQRKSLLQSLQTKKELHVVDPQDSIIKVDMNLISNTVRRGGLLHIGVKALAEGNSGQSYEQALKNNIVDLCQIEDAETAITALRKITKKPEEIEFLKKAIQNLDIFKSDGQGQKKIDLSHVFESKNATNQLFKGLKHLFIKKREPIFNYGDIGNLYYIILIGQVWTLIPENSELIPENSETQEVDNSKKKKENHHKQLTDEEFLAKNYPRFINVKIFQAGGAFGEIALLTKSKRTATMVAKEDTHLMTLSRQSFDQIIGTHKEQILQEKLNFLKNFSFFSEIPNSSLMSNILHYTNITYCKNKDVLYQEKDNVTSIYFIKSGEVILNKSVNIKDENFETKKETISSYVVLSHKESKNLQNGQSKKINYAYLGANTFFGEEEYYQKKQIRESKAICSSQVAEIYIINKDRVWDVIRKHGQQALFKEVLEYKQLRHEAQLRKFMQTQGFSSMALLKANALLKQKEISSDMVNGSNKGSLDLSVKRSDLLKFSKKSRTPWLPQPEGPKRERVNQHYSNLINKEQTDYKLQFTSQTQKILEAEEIMHSKMQEKILFQRISRNKIEEIFNQRSDLIYGFLNTTRKLPTYGSYIVKKQETSVFGDEYTQATASGSIQQMWSIQEQDEAIVQNGIGKQKIKWMSSDFGGTMKNYCSWHQNELPAMKVMQCISEN